MTEPDDAHIVAQHIRDNLQAAGVSPLDMTAEDVYQILLECLDDFHELPASQAKATAAEILQAWRNEQ